MHPIAPSEIKRAVVMDMAVFLTPGWSCKIGTPGSKGRKDGAPQDKELIRTNELRSPGERTLDASCRFIGAEY